MQVVFIFILLFFSARGIKMSDKSENAEASNEGRLDLDMLGVAAAEECLPAACQLVPEILPPNSCFWIWGGC